MSDRRDTEEVSVVCDKCGAVYPAFRFPDGKLSRLGNESRCRCGSQTFVELSEID